MKYLNKLKESSEKKVEKARKIERKARKGEAPKGRAYKAAWDAADSMARGRSSEKMAKSVNSLIKQRHSKLEEAKKKKGRCWTGYKPKPGSVPYSKGSCVKEGYKLLGLALLEYDVADINDKETDLKNNRKADNEKRKKKKTKKDLTGQASDLRARIIKRAGGIGKNMSEEGAAKEAGMSPKQHRKMMVSKKRVLGDNPNPHEAAGYERGAKEQTKANAKVSKKYHMSQRKRKAVDEEGPVTRAANKFAKKKEAASIKKTQADYAAVYGKPKPKDKK